MPAKNLVQIGCYVEPALKKALEQHIKRLGNRISISSYIEGLIRKHLEANGSV
jgi:hypothetical protein